MNIAEFIRSKSGIEYIKKEVDFFAYYYNVEYDEALSLLYFRLCLAAFNGKGLIEEIAGTYKYVRTAADNACKNLGSMKKKANILIDSNEMKTHDIARCSQEYEDWELHSLLNRSIANLYKKKPIHLQIYQRCILNQEKSHDVGQDLNISSGSVRIITARIRVKARIIYNNLIYTPSKCHTN